MHLRQARAALLLGLGVIAGSAHAVEMYRWVDEHGVTNISDAVPEKYRKSAERIESAQFNVTEAQRLEAAARAASAASAAEAAKPLAPATGPARRPARPGPARPAAASSSAGADVDCAALQQRYREAQDCFEAGAKNQNGSINANKSLQCPLVVDPSPQCGVPSQSPR